jgi:hypothetical protein
LRNLLLIGTILLFFLAAAPAFATTYWVDDNGTKTSAGDCDGATPISGTDACTLSAANGFVSAGDTVYLRGGTYTINGNGVYPGASGTVQERITYEAYQEEVVTFTDPNSTATCVNLKNGQDHITVRGIICQNFYHHLEIVGVSGSNYASYNEIDSCTFSGNPPDNDIDWKGSKLEDYTEYNWIHDCLFEKYGRSYNGFNEPDDSGVVLELGYDQSYIYTRYNVIEDNILQYGGHHVFGLQGYRNVARGNYIQNNGWMDASTYGGVYGTSYLYGGKVVYNLDISGYGQHLFEKNRVSYADQSPEDQSEGEAWLLGSPKNIIRYNVFDNNNENAFYIDSAHGACSQCSAEDSYIYNNTFWYNGQDRCTGARGCSPVFLSYSHSVAYPDSTCNMFKNNLHYNERNEIDERYSIASGNSTTYPSNADYVSLYESGQETEGDPFVQITDTPKDPEDKDQFDFLPA